MFFTWLSKLIIEIVTINYLGHSQHSDLLYDYTSPTILLCSISLLILFSNLRLNKKMIGFTCIFAPASFAVYLIHVNWYIWSLISKKLSFLSNYNAIIMLLSVLVIAICVWFVCSVIDKVRIAFFNLVKIKQLSLWIEKKLLHRFNSILNRFQLWYNKCELCETNDLHEN